MKSGIDELYKKQAEQRMAALTMVREQLEDAGFMKASTSQIPTVGKVDSFIDVWVGPRIVIVTRIFTKDGLLHGFDVFTQLSSSPQLAETLDAFKEFMRSNKLGVTDNDNYDEKESGSKSEEPPKPDGGGAEPA